MSTRSVAILMGIALGLVQSVWAATPLEDAQYALRLLNQVNSKPLSLKDEARLSTAIEKIDFVVQQLTQDRAMRKVKKLFTGFGDDPDLACDIARNEALSRCYADGCISCHEKQSHFEHQSGNGMVCSVVVEGERS